MDLDRTPVEISRVVAELAEEVRALNHRTLNAKAYESAPEVSDVADNIALLIQRLPQALQQLEAGLQALADNNQIRLADRHPDQVTPEATEQAVATALCGLEGARHALGAVEGHLRSATRVLGNLGGPWPEGDDED